MVVVSSGAIAAGLAPLGLKTRPRDLAMQQAAASVGRPVDSSLHRKFRALSGNGIASSSDDARYYPSLTLQKCAASSQSAVVTCVVPVINENDTVGTQEIRFGDNDRLAALVALLIGADLLVLISDIDALYDAPPSRVGAQRITDVQSVADDDASLGE